MTSPTSNAQASNSVEASAVPKQSLRARRFVSSRARRYLLICLLLLIKLLIKLLVIVSFKFVSQCLKLLIKKLNIMMRVILIRCMQMN